MKVIRSQSAGFCWGVERAIDIAAKFADEGRHPVYTDGPLIHNKQMMEKLTQKGIREVGDYQSTTAVKVSHKEEDEPIMVVRAHGISPERRKYLKSLDMEFRDATCPDVGIIAGKIRMHAKKDFSTVIFGDPKHPEVMGLMGYTEGKGHVIQSTEDIDQLPTMDKVCLVSQSTMFTHEFHELSVYLKGNYPDAVVIDTICGATKERQTGVVELAAQGAEAIVVIGGKHSANTRKLALLAKQQKLPTYHIETWDDLDIEEIMNFQTVGVTAGASTPDFIIDDVCTKLEAV
ncbi:MAG: 4-hydroxy-3-methylbut-2-enyl diphosphate reductase [Verrucomicrobia bacterium]|nr:4-hydroxy-3-methylbut-2-enyl diphosphate reductase [Verrucomicrobiota bacterium]MDA1067570.1 4-hydroxy-3-methylbut-2-enyl diphosphate reductase [Verrucomicrobiota bacterium]